MELNKKPLVADILSLLHTKVEADHFLTQMDLLSESLFSNKTSLKEKMNEFFSSEVVLSLTNIWQQAGIDINNIIELQHFLAEIKDSIRRTPVINLTIAFKPKEKTIQRIFEWVSFRLKSPILLNINVEKQIIGGAIIEFKGKYFEYTIHKVLEEKMASISKHQKTVSNKSI